MRQGLGLILLGLFSLLCHAADPAVQRATDWLLTQAQDDGAFYSSGTVATPFQATSEVLRIEGINTSAARLFLQQHPFDGSEYLARRLRLGIGDLTRLQAQLLSRQNPDGGIGDLAAYQSSVLDTAFALAVVDSEHPATQAAVAFLLAEQRADGGWADGPNLSNSYTTTLALEGLQAFRSEAHVSAARQAARGFLLDQLATPLSNARLALILRGLLPLETGTALEDALVQLRAAQGAEGSWDNDVYTTALAAQVLSMSTRTPVNPDMAVLRGAVMSTTTGWPLASASLSLTGDLSLAASSDVDGIFRFGGLAPGSYQLRVSAPAHLPVEASLQIQAGEDHDLGSLFLARSPDAENITIFGVIKDRHGNLLEGVLIEAGGEQVFSDAVGRYWLNQPQAGDTTVEVSLAGYQSVTTNLTLSEGGYTVFSPVLYPIDDTPSYHYTRVEGVVVDALDGEIIPGVSVGLFGAIGSPTNSSGRFSMILGSNYEGSLPVTLRRLGYQPWEMTVWVNAGRRNDLGTLRMTPEMPAVADLFLSSLDSMDISTDPLSYSVTGELEVQVVNAGPIASSTAQLLVYADDNADGVHSPGEQRLGEATIPPLASAESSHLVVGVRGYGAYRDAPLGVLADSTGQVMESREDNNALSSLYRCQEEATPVGALYPVEKWRWAGDSATTTPLVATIQDTNGDGVLNEQDTPAVLLITHDRDPDGKSGTLVAVDGISGLSRWSVTTPGVHSLSQLAVGDLDADGFPEIIARRYPTGTVVFNGQGQVLWESTIPDYQVANNAGGVSLADLDADGQGEIIYTRMALNNDGSLRWFGAGSAHGRGLNVVADINLDGSPEVVVGNSLYAADGQLLWEQTTLPDGSAAVAELDGDAELEIILVGTDAQYRGVVYALDGDGSPLWGPIQFASRNLGVPTIGDINGDGQVEIGVASRYAYTMLRADGSPLWEQPTNDPSGLTSASFFDLDNDGTQEVIYADSQLLHILDGETGLPRYQLDNPSYTGYESPVVADIDQDGHAEIVLTSSDTRHTLRVLENLADDWPPTRSIYHQYNYHPGAISELGALPQVAGQGWAGFNAFRNNPVTASGAQVDWSIGGLEVLQQVDGSTDLRVRLANAGAASGTATLRLFQTEVDGERLLGEQQLSLAMGQFEDIHLNDVYLRGGALLRAEVEDSTGSSECRLDNNQVSAGVNGQGLGRLSINTSVQTVAGEPLEVTAQVHNPGALNQEYRLHWELQDSAGEWVLSLDERTLEPLQGGATLAVTAQLPVMGLLAGEYRLVAHLQDSLGQELDQQVLPLTLLGDGIPPTLSLSLGAREYAPSEAVTLLLTLHNPSENQALASGELILNVQDALGQTVLSHTLVAPPLAPGQHQALEPWLYPSSRWQSGAYQLIAEWRSGTESAHAGADFNVSDDPLVGLDAQITVASPLISPGDDQQCDYRVNNPIPGTAFRLGMRRLGEAEPGDWITLWAADDGSALFHQQIIASAGLANGDWLCEIQTQVEGIWWSLGYAGFRRGHASGGVPVGDPLPLWPEQNYPDGYPQPEPIDEHHQPPRDASDNNEAPQTHPPASTLTPVAVPLGGTSFWLLLISTLLLLGLQGVAPTKH